MDATFLGGQRKYLETVMGKWASESVHFSVPRSLASKYMSEIAFGKILADHIVFHLFQSSAVIIQIRKSKYANVDSKRMEILKMTVSINSRIIFSGK